MVPGRRHHVGLRDLRCYLPAGVGGSGALPLPGNLRPGPHGLWPPPASTSRSPQRAQGTGPGEGSSSRSRPAPLPEHVTPSGRARLALKTERGRRLDHPRTPRAARTEARWSGRGRRGLRAGSWVRPPCPRRAAVQGGSEVLRWLSSSNCAHPTSIF